MSGYRRIVSYLYKYSNGKKAENTGFVRVETREGVLRLHVQLKDLKMMEEKRIKVYFYFHNDEKHHTIFVDEFLCSRGNCEYKKMVPIKMLSTEFDKISGIVFCDEKNLLYGSCWDDLEIDMSRLVFKGQEENDEINVPMETELVDKDASEDTESEIEHLESNEIHQENSMNQLLNNLPKIILKDNPNFIDAAKIDLADISKLSYKDWKLAENTFLRQGYETHEYLLLGKIEFQPNQTVWVLGVPGTYDNREKYLANIFGFFDYIPEENSKFRTGGKGYWITRLNEI